MSAGDCWDASAVARALGSLACVDVRVYQFLSHRESAWYRQRLSSDLAGVPLDVAVSAITAVFGWAYDRNYNAQKV